MATLKGVFPNLTTTRKKNFIQENVKNLRRMEQCFHSNKEADELHKFQINRHRKSVNKYSNVTAKVNSTFRGSLQTNQFENVMSNKETEIIEKEPLRKLSAPIFNKKNTVPAKKLVNPMTNKLVNKQKKKDGSDIKNDQQGTKIKSNPNFMHDTGEDGNDSSLSINAKYKHKGIQTLEEKNMDQLYMEGVIRYPTKRNIKCNEEKNKNEANKASNGHISLSEQGDGHVFTNIQSNDSKISELPAINEGIDTIKSSKDRNSVASKIAMQLNNGVVPTNYRKGVVPKYDVKNILKIEKKHSKERKKLKQLHSTLSVQKVTSPYRTRNDRKHCEC